MLAHEQMHLHHEQEGGAAHSICSGEHGVEGGELDFSPEGGLGDVLVGSTANKEGEKERHRERDIER